MKTSFAMYADTLCVSHADAVVMQAASAARVPRLREATKILRANLSPTQPVNSMNAKLRIEVRDENNQVVKIIYRKVWREAIGNFQPVFCRYMNARHLVQSDELHLDDPLRCNGNDHINHLFIRVGV